MATSESRQRQELVGVRLTAAELRDATAAAELRGISVPELLRLSLRILLATPDAATRAATLATKGS